MYGLQLSRLRTASYYFRPACAPSDDAWIAAVLPREGVSLRTSLHVPLLGEAVSRCKEGGLFPSTRPRSSSALARPAEKLPAPQDPERARSRLRKRMAGRRRASGAVDTLIYIYIHLCVWVGGCGFGDCIVKVLSRVAQLTALHV